MGEAVDEDLRATVLDVFRTVLGKPGMTVDDDFFDAGGDSLLAVDAADQLSERLGREVDPGNLIMYATAAALAEAIPDPAAGS